MSTRRGDYIPAHAAVLRCLLHGSCCFNGTHGLHGARGFATAINIPLLHIADPTGEKIKAAGFEKVGLLGTAFTYSG